MNILHYVTKKEEVNHKLKKLKASIDAAYSESDEASGSSKTCSLGLDKDELQKRLSPAEFRITQQKGTERPHSGKYNKMSDEGMYNCVVCGTQLFASDDKYNSGSGWPAFSDVVAKEKILLVEENLGGLQRLEVRCRSCRSHLGHVFDDGPKPTGVRYCINSCSLDFRKHTTV